MEETGQTAVTPAKETDQTNASPAEETEQDTGSNDPAVDLGGMSLSILQPWEITSPLGYKTETLFSDLAFARFEERKKSFNCNVDLVYTTDIKGTVQSASAASGERLPVRSGWNSERHP
jgi:hypothetical protein